MKNPYRFKIRGTNGTLLLTSDVRFLSIVSMPDLGVAMLGGLNQPLTCSEIVVLMPDGARSMFNVQGAPEEIWKIIMDNRTES